MHIFAVVANSAACERAFSNFGITHTKLRNKLDALRVHKTATVRMEQQRTDREAGLAHNHKKRKFGEDGTTATDLPASDSGSIATDNLDSPPAEFRQYAANLIQRAAVSNGGNNQDPRTTQPNAASSSRKTQILLANLFDYTLSPEEGLEFYWPGSKKNLETDLLAHEHALADELSDSSST